MECCEAIQTVRVSAPLATELLKKYERACRARSTFVNKIGDAIGHREMELK
jgi:hypothetical protein